MLQHIFVLHAVSLRITHAHVGLFMTKFYLYQPACILLFIWSVLIFSLYSPHNYLHPLVVLRTSWYCKLCIPVAVALKTFDLNIDWCQEMS